MLGEYVLAEASRYMAQGEIVRGVDGLDISGEPIEGGVDGVQVEDTVGRDDRCVAVKGTGDGSS